MHLFIFLLNLTLFAFVIHAGRWCVFMLVCTVRLQLLVFLPIICMMTKGKGDNKSNPTNVSPLGDDAKTIINSMNAQFSSLREDLLALTDKHDELKIEIVALRAVIADRDESINDLKSEVDFMRSRVSKLENLIDDEDAYIRRESLILSGSAVPPRQNGEISSNVARQVIKDKLKIIVQPNEISVCHRLGPKPMNQAANTRPLTVRFCRRDTKRSILLAKRDNSDVHSTLFTNESLTPKRWPIMYSMRLIKKKATPTSSLVVILLKVVVLPIPRCRAPCPIQRHVTGNMSLTPMRPCQIL